MMEHNRLLEKHTDFTKALGRLDEVLNAEIRDDYIFDAAIQRFEFTYELAWKLIKAYMNFQGLAEVNTPREAFKEAFAIGLIAEGDIWIEMLKDRNLTSHTYDQIQAKKIYQKVKDQYINLFKLLNDKIKGAIEK